MARKGIEETTFVAEVEALNTQVKAGNINWEEVKKKSFRIANYANKRTKPVVATVVPEVPAVAPVTPVLETPVVVAPVAPVQEVPAVQEPVAVSA